MSYIYLAQPYTHPDASVQVRRYNAAIKALSWAVEHELPMYSPIAHFHHVSIEHGIPGTVEMFWRQNSAMILGANELWVYCLDGWEKSKGVVQEIKFARDIQIPYHFITESEMLASIRKRTL